MRSTGGHLGTGDDVLGGGAQALRRDPALDDAGITLVSGEVHALVGENGAGKSTLIKVMTGIYQPDEGSITIDGVAAELTSSAEAQARGIVAIYQEPMIYPDLSVAENIFIGHRNRGRLVHWRRMYDEADAILRSLAIDVDARALGHTLAVAAQQASRSPRRSPWTPVC